jgi:hypothetical protein
MPAARMARQPSRCRDQAQNFLLDALEVVAIAAKRPLNRARRYMTWHDDAFIDMKDAII